MMYKFLGSIQYNPMMEIFRLFALRDPVSFQAMLAVASKHRAAVEGKIESVQSLTHKMRALRLINERIQTDDGRQDDGTIYAAASMSVIEVGCALLHYIWLLTNLACRNGPKMHPSNVCTIRDLLP